MTQLARLDYDTDELFMLCETEVERTKRVVAVQKERETVAFIESIPRGSVFFDVGANVGSYTLIALSRGLEVVAFEASIPNFQRLNDNIRLNGFKCRTVAVPLWNRREKVGWVSAGDDPGTALHSIGPNGVMRWAIPLDYWIDSASPTDIPHPDYLKVDVDGVELQVLQGAERTLKFDVKALLVENDETVEDHKDIPGFLERLGFHEEERYPHGNSPVSNVLYRRR